MLALTQLETNLLQQVLMEQLEFTMYSLGHVQQFFKDMKAKFLKSRLTLKAQKS